MNLAKRKFLINADKIVTELNLKIKNNIKGKRINKLNLSELFSDLNIKTERKNKNQEENLFAITRPLNTNFRDKYRDSDYQFKRLASILEKESHKKTFIKNHKFDKKAFPAIFSQIKKMDAETGK